MDSHMTNPSRFQNIFLRLLFPLLFEEVGYEWYLLRRGSVSYTEVNDTNENKCSRQQKQRNFGLLHDAKEPPS